jgi:hypothetical protein
LRFNIKTSDVLIKGYICVAWKGGGGCHGYLWVNNDYNIVLGNNKLTLVRGRIFVFCLVVFFFVYLKKNKSPQVRFLFSSL